MIGIKFSGAYFYPYVEKLKGHYNAAKTLEF